MTADRSQTEEQDSAGGTRTVSSSNTGYQTVYQDGSQGTPFVAKTITPKVEGVLVVAEGAGKGNMTSEITQIAQALFGVEAHKVKVLENESQETYPHRRVHTIEYKIKKADTGLWKGERSENLIKKNQLMITALAIMIAIAGYLQFAGTNLERSIWRRIIQKISVQWIPQTLSQIWKAWIRMWRSSWKIIWMKICRWQRLRRTKGRFPGKQC